jgi:hypothetical protein
MSKKMTKTPAKRSIEWAKRHGRPMDSTVILAWEAGWNARCREHRAQWKRSTASAEDFERFQMGLPPATK